MATHRSLNKLEFKAHMSIHNMADVREEECHEANYTRDRFGKNHRLAEEDGTSRLKKRSPKLGAVVALVTLSLPVSLALADTRPVESGPGPNVRVESGDVDELWANHVTSGKKEPFGLPVDEKTSVGINEDGDPSLNMRF